ncbi:DUF4113 domain-containing protein [Rhizobium rhizogenes]|uniref:DUF4113 domain-containing protein n=1 Tax=Rhizobium rhizogenes TaxID=359 RepID=UPI001401CD77
MQAGLFHAADCQARRDLIASLAGLNHRYGRGTVAFATSGLQKAWKLRSDQKSPAYTARRISFLEYLNSCYATKPSV